MLENIETVMALMTLLVLEMLKAHERNRVSPYCFNNMVNVLEEKDSGGIEVLLL